MPIINPTTAAKTVPSGETKPVTKEDVSTNVGTVISGSPAAIAKPPNNDTADNADNANFLIVNPPEKK
jgi:hypothetical protein